MGLGVHLRCRRIARARFRVPFDARSLRRLRAAGRQALLEVADGGTEASPQFRQAPRAEHDKCDQQDEEEMGRLKKTLEHGVILLRGDLAQRSASALKSGKRPVLERRWARA